MPPSAKILPSISTAENKGAIEHDATTKSLKFSPLLQYIGSSSSISQTHNVRGIERSSKRSLSISFSITFAFLSRLKRAPLPKRSRKTLRNSFDCITRKISCADLSHPRAAPMSAPMLVPLMAFIAMLFSCNTLMAPSW